MACVPVPKASPASMRSGIAPPGTGSVACEGCTQKRPTRNGWKERWFSATQSVSGSTSMAHAGAARPACVAAAAIASRSSVRVAASGPVASAASP